MRQGDLGSVSDPDWSGRVKVTIISGVESGSIKSYIISDLEKVTTLASTDEDVDPFSGLAAEDVEMVPHLVRSTEYQRWYNSKRFP